MNRRAAAIVLAVCLVFACRTTPESAALVGVWSNDSQILEAAPGGLRLVLREDGSGLPILPPNYIGPFEDFVFTLRDKWLTIRFADEDKPDEVRTLTLMVAFVGRAGDHVLAAPHSSESPGEPPKLFGAIHDYWWSFHRTAETDAEAEALMAAYRDAPD